MDKIDNLHAPKTNGSGNNNTGPIQINMASSLAALQIGGGSGAANIGSTTTTIATTEEAHPKQSIILTPSLSSGGHNFEVSQAVRSN